MGEKAYVVTFRDFDPFFVIDLKNKTAPKVLGELKIPGYSDYLHPYDENHIIGFGKDTVVVNGTAYYLGMKIAMFDVTDVNNLKEMFVEKIGDRGTESELLYNHKALLFNKEKDLLAFPVQVYKVKGDLYSEYGYPNYGELAFNGAYVYDISLESGFVKKGEITHSDSQQDPYGYNHYNSAIQRMLNIGDQLFAVSNHKVTSHSLSSVSPIGSLSVSDK